MRSAPFGLDPRLTTPEAATTATIEGSVLTHGHPTAGVAAAGLAVLIHHLMGGVDLTDAVQRTVEHLARLDGHAETTGAITGNILGALHGEQAIPAAWARAVEGRETILDLADRLDPA